MNYLILGPLAVVDGAGEQVDIGGAHARSMLSMLVAADEQVVPVDTIIDRLWPDGPPASAQNTVQSYVSRLRRVVDRGAGASGSRRLTFESSGYRLRILDGDQVDARSFEEAADRGRELLAAGDATAARAALSTALELWRGPALADVADQDWARGPATRLEERRIAAIEDRIEADLRLGRHDVVTGELQDLVHTHPLRESLWEQLALALYRSGRQAEALRALDEVRTLLRDTLGVDPGRGVRDLEAQILQHDPALAAPPTQPATGRDDERIGAGTSAAGDTGEAPGVVVSDGHHVEGLTALDELIGRAGERDALQAVLDRAGQHTQWVLLEGEPGIGKTRLLEHLAEEASRRGFYVVWGRSYESTSVPAFWPWLQAIRALMELATDLPDETRRLLDRVVSPSSEELADLPGEGARFRLYEAIALLLERASLRRPLMIAIDDLQWADPASLGLVELLAGYVVGFPILVAATVRELEIGRNDEVVRALSAISRRPQSLRLRLSGLAPEETQGLVRRTIGDHAPDDVVRAIHRRSGGNPFFVGELARLLATETDLTETELVRRVGVPAGVRDVVHRRLVRLPAATIELLQVLATLGADAGAGLLARTAGVSLDRCLDDLEPALVDRLVVEAPDRPGWVRFSHALVREVVLDDLSTLRRARLHLRAADAMESGGVVPEDDAELVADHLWQASSLGLGERVPIALERAAGIALRRFAYETGDELLERALQLRQAMPDGDPGAELDAIYRLAGVRRIRFGFQRARLQMPMERAKHLARRTGRHLVLCDLLWTEWAGAATSCELTAAHRLARELLALSESTQDPTIEAVALASWGIQCWHEGRMGESVEYMDRAIERHDTLPQGALTSEAFAEHEVLARGFRTAFHELHGSPVDDDPLSHAPSEPYPQLVASTCESLRRVIGGDYEIAKRVGEVALAMPVAEDFEFFRAGLTCMYGAALIGLGELEAGIAALRRGHAAYEGSAVLTVVPFYLVNLAEGLAALGELVAARGYVTQAREVLERAHEMWNAPFVMTAEAVVAVAEGTPPEEVHPILRAAHELALAQESGGAARWVRDRAARLGLQLDTADVD